MVEGTKYEEFRTAMQTHYDADTRKVAIELQDIPDPDAMASGLFMYQVLKHIGFEPTVTYGSPLAHPQNIVMSRRLNLNEIMVRHDDIDRETIDAYIYVDHSGKTSKWNEEVMADNKLIAIIDHHDLDDPTPEGIYVDKRRVGAVSSMLAEYLKQGAMDCFGNDGVERVATALILGVRTDTGGLMQNTTELDDEMHIFLREFANMDTVKAVENINWPKEWLTLYGQAIANRKTQDGVTIASLGYVDREKRDVIAMVADQLLREESVHTVYAYGLHQDIDISIRTRSETYDFKTLQKLFPEGNSGGKEGAGGVQIPNLFSKEAFEQSFLDPESEEDQHEQERMIRKKLEKRIFS